MKAIVSIALTLLIVLMLLMAVSNVIAEAVEAAVMNTIVRLICEHRDRLFTGRDHVEVTLRCMAWKIGI